MICGWRNPFPLFCNRLLIVMQAHHQHSTAGKFPQIKRIAFLVHVNHIGIQINHSKIQLNKFFSLLIQFNKIAVQCNICEASLIKYKFTLPTIEK